MSKQPIDDQAKKDYAKGKEIYETKIKPLVDPQEKGKFLVLDINTEDYAIGSDLGYTTKELRDRRPDAVIHTVRIGYPAVYRLLSPRILWNAEREL